MTPETLFPNVHRSAPIITVRLSEDSPHITVYGWRDTADTMQFDILKNEKDRIIYPHTTTFWFPYTMPNHNWTTKPHNEFSLETLYCVEKLFKLPVHKIQINHKHTFITKTSDTEWTDALITQCAEIIFINSLVKR